MSTSAGGLIAITGAATLTPLGDSPDALFAALCEGRSALATGVVDGPRRAVIADFDASRYATIRGMRLYNRTTQLGICATKLALDDAGLDPASLAAEDLGVLAASTYGHLDVLLDYDRSLVLNGTQKTNAALMPLAIPSAPGAMVALSFHAKALSLSLGNGAAGALDALGLAARWLADGRARACVVVASFSASAEVLRLLLRTEALATTDEVRPFDRRGSGVGLGEAAVAFVLEPADAASQRGARIRGQVLGYGAAFPARGTPSAQDAIARAAQAALDRAGDSLGRLALVSAAASGDPVRDREEASALSTVLGARAGQVPVVAVSGALGEAFDAAGALQALVALSCVEHGKAPPIAALEDPLVPELRYVRRVQPIERGLALVTSRGRGGSCSALLLAGGPPRGAAGASR